MTGSPQVGTQDTLAQWGPLAFPGNSPPPVTESPGRLQNVLFIVPLSSIRKQCCDCV